MKKLGLVLALAAQAALAASPTKQAPDRLWQQGMLLNPENNAYFKSVPKSEALMTPEMGPTTVSYLNSATAVSTRDSYVLNTEDAAYLVERVRLSSSPSAKVFITMDVKFFVQKNKVYLVDREGREVETKIVKQARKDSPLDGK